MANRSIKCLLPTDPPNLVQSSVKMSIPSIASEQEFENYLQNSPGLLVNFTASWCGPCKAMAPVLEQLYRSFGNVDVIKVDIDSFRELAARLQVASIPTYIFYHNSAEINRVMGANRIGVIDGLQQLSNLVGDATRYAGGDSQAAQTATEDVLFEQSQEFSQISKYIPRGFNVLNSTIFFGEFESLNVETIDPSNKDVTNVIRKVPTENKPTGIVSDADSQILLHLPLTNVAKVYSVLIKSSKSAKYNDEAVQLPSKVKIWSGATSIISFDHAETSTASHEEELDESSWDSNGWYEIKLKYVRFQKVTSLDLFFEGEDEDEHTYIERVLIVGVDGESKKQGKLEKIGDD